jgi:hypothetical protein
MHNSCYENCAFAEVRARISLKQSALQVSDGTHGTGYRFTGGICCAMKETFYMIATRKLKFQIKMSISTLDAFMFGIGCCNKKIPEEAHL